MSYYITYGEFQKHLKDFFLRTGSRMQFPEMTNYLYSRGLLLETCPYEFPANRMYGEMTDKEFDNIVDSFVLTVNPDTSITPNVTEPIVIPPERDVFIIRHMRYTRPYMHCHNFFEIDFVADGKCQFFFEKEHHVLRTGELCIIAPSSLHDLLVDDDDSLVFCILIRKSTFNTTFFSLMSQKNLLSYFFRRILQRDSHPNYLLFYSDHIQWLKNLMRNAMGECYKQDEFSNNNAIHWMHLFFTELLRNYSRTIQFYDYKMGTDFSLILQYIQHNYQTLTLASLSEFFHYSQPHLSTLIKQNTGCSFTTLVRELKMADAVSFLVNTNMKIGEIADCVGYHSTDHFSRVFRSEYKMSPQEYRRRHRGQNPSDC